MANERYNGAIMSANQPTDYSSSMIKKDYLHKVLLTSILYTDAKRNITRGTPNPEITYTGVLLGGLQEGLDIDNIRDGVSLGGSNTNYSERVYSVADRPTNQEELHNTKGDIVYVLFLQGDSSYPIIVGKANAFKTQELKAGKVEIKVGATEAEGPLFRWQYNGLFYKVDKEGELEITRKGGKLSQGRFTPEPEEINYKFKLKSVKDTFTLVFKNGIKLAIDDSEGIDSITLKTKGKATLSLKEGKVALGTSEVELLQLIVDYLVIFETHTHIGNLGFPTVYNAAPQQVMLQTIKDGLANIKGTIESDES